MIDNTFFFSQRKPTNKSGATSAGVLRWNGHERTELPNDFRGEQAAGGKPYYLVPVFTEWDDRLFVRCIPPYILASQRHADAPRLSAEARTAIAAVSGPGA